MRLKSRYRYLLCCWFGHPCVSGLEAATGVPIVPISPDTVSAHLKGQQPSGKQKKCKSGN
ncbi:hypothetical protein PF005_g6763 [Phytophthora fragariae]|uniref:Uncharacterized protein n=1 Tax=Phytophthora fragariae TaxID=53985 RepID=A0A6A3FKE7_9STRA|nr:hypothetical protein PF003_g3247 [Phytophthora fragariae]KAE8944450.1 hypothetical protein PF009_g5862 [Phytophthora fragariae]KAE9021703.1 hypothetical protein PF011_g4807 [Phytophthora fragariae]KAE9123630.1 hypothetical protein PF007_g6981 [Phytophthora fragariae]KAE9124493.1 hypothetical protein PF010_g5977 [Phytophthora fragariae]